MSTRDDAATWVSVTRYCELYDVNRKTVYKYLDAGLLQSWRVGRVLRVAHRPPLAAVPQRSLPVRNARIT
jgi:hypothetical protein